MRNKKNNNKKNHKNKKPKCNKDVVAGFYVGDANSDARAIFIQKRDLEVLPMLEKYGKLYYYEKYPVGTYLRPNSNFILPKKRERRIPNEYLCSNQKRVCSFLRGLYSANGNATEKHIELTQSSKSLIDAVASLLKGLGIVSILVVKNATDTTIKGRLIHWNAVYKLYIHQKASRTLFYEKIGFLHKYKMKHYIKEA